MMICANDGFVNLLQLNDEKQAFWSEEQLYGDRKKSRRWRFEA